tara:strand:+ start:234 stop:581 length:348 start_codon:yes stop_codon:yes gene_type:complete
MRQKQRKGLVYNGGVTILASSYQSVFSLLQLGFVRCNALLHACTLACINLSYAQLHLLNLPFVRCRSVREQNKQTNKKISHWSGARVNRNKRFTVFKQSEGEREAQVSTQNSLLP